MSAVTAKNLILSQPKTGQSDAQPVTLLTHTTYAEESATVVKIEIPGVDPSTVDVSFENNNVHVNCERGTLSLPVDPTIDTSKIKGDILWGMLTLTIPLPAPPVAHSIKLSIHDAVKASKFTEKE